jgi:antitoxin component YwqK of YwqJK toxin-antitoxin module
MKRHLFVLGAFLFPFLLAGQQDTGKYGQKVRYFYESGKVSSEGFMKDGVPNGIWTSYHENGALKSLGLKRNGTSDSIWSFYTLDGTLKTSISYTNGKKNGSRKEFSTDG